MNKIQESFTKIIIQYVKETYPNDQTLKYLIDGIDNFTDKNIQTEVEKPRYAYPIPESIINDKDRIKEIMNKILDVNFKPNGIYVKQDDIYVQAENPEAIPEDEKLIPTEDIKE